MKDLSFAVIGAGHGGKALAAHLAVKGFSVNLYNRTISRIKPIIKMKGIELEGEIKGFGRLGCVTDDIEKAIKDVDVIINRYEHNLKFDNMAVLPFKQIDALTYRIFLKQNLYAYTG